MDRVGGAAPEISLAARFFRRARHVRAGRVLVTWHAGPVIDFMGTMDRVTGGVSITEHWIREIWDSKSYPNQPEMKFPRDEEISYNLTCKRTNPVF